MENEPMGKALKTALTRLPPEDATLAQLVRFCDENSPVQEFRQRWGAEYNERVQELWARSTHAFREGRPIGASPDELLLCMAYDATVAPYIGVPADISLRYLHAVLKEIRRSVKQAP